jgi:membrane-associated phospholipid phosphatase
LVSPPPDPGLERDESHPFGDAVSRFDLATDRVLARLHNPSLDLVAYAASAIGDWSVLWHLVGGARAIRDRGRLRQSIGLSAGLAVESLLVNQGVKRLFRRVRPVAERDHPHRLRVPATSSFPSGHASSAFFAATFLAEQHSPATPLLYAMAGVVAMSRPYVRAHHTSDVIAGAALGTLIGLIARQVARRI